MLRFHLDEHVPHSIAHGLRRRQIDVTTATDASLLGATDDEHLAYALREGRAIFTNDADFLRAAAQGIVHSGIVYCSVSDSRIGEVVRYLAMLHDCLAPDDMANRVEFL